MLTEKDSNVVVVPNVFKNLSVILSDEEIKTRSLRSAELWHESVALKDEKSEVTKDFTERLKAKTAEIGRLSDAIRTGAEVQLVECYHQFLFRENLVKTFRTDSGAMVDSRSMTREERTEYGQIEAQLG